MNEHITVGNQDFCLLVYKNNDVLSPNSEGERFEDNNAHPSTSRPIPLSELVIVSEDMEHVYAVLEQSRTPATTNKDYSVEQNNVNRTN